MNARVVPLRSGRDVLQELQNPVAEQALLAAILVSNSVYQRVAPFLRPEHFADALHGRIYEACGRLIQRGQIANIVTLKNLFDQDHALADVGGAQYLARLVNAVVTVINAEDYATTILDLWQRRQLVALQETLLGRILDFDVPADSLVAELERQVVQYVSPVGTAMSKREVAERVVERLRSTAPCYSTGLAGLARALDGCLFAGKMIGIGARKKVGKTILCGTISDNLNAAGVPHLFIPHEMTREEIEQRSIARRCGFNDRQFRLGLTPDQMRRVGDYVVQMPAGVTWYEHAPNKTLDDVQRMVAGAVVRHRIKGFIIDYLQLIGGKRGNESRADHIDRVAQWIADYCKAEGLFALVMMQVNQEGNTRGGEGPRLACDAYFELHRDPDSEWAWLEMQESRYTEYRDVGRRESADSEGAAPWSGLRLRTDSGPWYEDVTEQQQAEAPQLWDPEDPLV